MTIRSVMALMITALLAGPASSQSNPDLIIRGGKYFDTDSGTMRDNEGLVIRDGRIVSMDLESASEPADRELQIPDDHFVLPGLIDLHAHYNVRLMRRRREEFDVNPILYLANGVTVTFSAGEYDPEGMLDLRKRIEQGEIIGPKLINSGPYFGSARPGWNRAITAAEIYREVDHWVRQGVGGFKAKSIDRESLRALIERAQFHELTVTGHLGSGFRNSVNPSDAIDLGINRVEHFLGGDAFLASRPAYNSLAALTADHPDFKAIVKKYVETGTVYDATITAFGYFGERGEEFDYWIDERLFLTPYMQEQIADRRSARPNELFERVYQAKQKLILPFFEAGGIITMGTDHFSSGEFVSGFCAHRELDAFVRAGIPTADALRIGTINGATALGIDKDFGSIAAGKMADLFIVQGNPLDRIRNTRNVIWVVRAGQVHDSRELLESVKGKLGPESERDAENW